MSCLKHWKSIKHHISMLQSEVDKLAISPRLIRMLIVAEDHRYSYHLGVDPIALFRAFCHSAFYGKREGGSTIAMQLVRVITGKYERTLSRKIVEMYLALRLSLLVPKAELPKLYLFVAYFGWRMNGIVQARNRLGLDLSGLSETEAAELIARLKYPQPRNYNAKRTHQIKLRGLYILGRLEWFNKKISLN
ncbi:MAG: transglycosylase domain-containing protein [Endozoicomonadaceae bacterium]|nr:transglycosylase domain-containing protein [Endozoicomonadaceae bacterium]